MSTHTQPAPGFEQAEVFTNQVEFSAFVRRLIPTLVMIFVVFTALVAFALSAAKLGPAVAWGVALPASALLCGLLYVVKKRQFEAVWTRTTLELSPLGAVLSEPRLRIEMPWATMSQIGDAQLMSPLRVIVANEGLAKAAYAVAAATSHRVEEGLIGQAKLVASPDAPRMLRAQIDQNDEAWLAAHPGQSRPPRAIVLTHYDPAWRTGRIGQWVRAYRPDLLATA